MVSASGRGGFCFQCSVGPGVLCKHRNSSQTVFLKCRSRAEMTLAYRNLVGCYQGAHTEMCGNMCVLSHCNLWEPWVAGTSFWAKSQQEGEEDIQ